MKGWVLTKEEQDIADWMLRMFDYKKLDCWDCEIPEDFENHVPLKEMFNRDR